MAVQGTLWLAKRFPSTLISVFLTGFHYFSYQIATQLSSQGWVYSVPDPILPGIPEGKRPLRRVRCRWEDIIKMDLKEVSYDARNWMDLAQDQDQWRTYVREIMNLWVA